MEEIDLIYTINMGRISVKYYKYFVNICKIFKKYLPVKCIIHINQGYLMSTHVVYERIIIFH